jgi:S1-C subfamily serine protease
LPSLLTTRYRQPVSANPLWLAIIALGTALLVGCGPAATNAGGETTSSIDPELRAVRLETTGCELSSERFGSGVAVGSGLVVTVAHLIVRAESVDASVAGNDPEGAVVAAVDLKRDLAVLRLATPLGLPHVATATVGGGTSGLIVGAATSGTVPFEVKRRVNLTIEEILGTDRHARLGYEVTTVTTDGDSGAGAYDEQNRLIGIVFATGRDGETSWLTASPEIEDFLATTSPSDTYPVCSR